MWTEGCRKKGMANDFGEIKLHNCLAAGRQMHPIADYYILNTRLIWETIWRAGTVRLILHGLSLSSDPSVGKIKWMLMWTGSTHKNMRVAPGFNSKFFKYCKKKYLNVTLQVKVKLILQNITLGKWKPTIYRTPLKDYNHVRPQRLSSCTESANCRHFRAASVNTVPNMTCDHAMCSSVWYSAREKCIISVKVRI